jgi:hypothetical protein
MQPKPTALFRRRDVRGQLLPEGEVLEDERSMRAREEDEPSKSPDKPRDHGSG